MNTPAASSGNPFRAILDVGAALVSSLNLEEVFANVAEKIGAAMMSWSVDIQTYDRERDTLRYEAYWCQDGLSDEDRAYIGTVTHVGDRPDFRRIILGKEVVEWHIDDPGLPADERAQMQRWGYKSTLDAPLMAGGEVIGILGLAETRFTRHYTSIEIDLFRQLCDLAAVGITNARTFRRQQEQTRYLDALLDSSRAITSSVDLGEVLKTVAEKAAKALGSPECVIYELDESRDSWVWRALYPPETLEAMSDKVGETYPLEDGDRRAMELGAPYLETLSDEDLAPESRASMEDMGEKSCLNVPMMFEGVAVGMLVLIETETERRFTDIELELARALGEQAGMAIRNAEAYQRQEAESRRTHALLDAARAITSTVDLDEVLARVTREACKALGVAATSVYEYYGDSDTYAYKALYEAVPTSVPDDDLGTPYSLADYPGDRILLESPRPVVHQLSDPELPPDRRESMSQYDEQTTLNVPLRFGAEPLGILRFYVYEKERRFTDDEIDLAAGLGEQAAIAVWNARQYASVELARQRTDTLLEAGRTIASSVDLDEVLRRVTQEACRVLGVSAAAVYEYDPPRDRFSYIALFEETPTEGPDDEIGKWNPLSERPGERAIYEAADVVVEYLSDPELPADRRASMESWNERTCLNVPLRVGSDRLGTLRFYDYERERHFGEAELTLARGLCEQAAIAISNARLYDRVERARKRTDTLLEASRALTTSLASEAVFDAITRYSSEAFNAPRCALYEYDTVDETLTARSFFEQTPVDGYKVLNVPEPVDRRPGDRVILDGGEIVIEDADDDGVQAATRAEMQFWGESTCLNVPLAFRGEPLGILMVIFVDDRRAFSDDELALAAGLGEQAAVALFNARLFARVEREQRRTAALFEASRTLTSTLVREEVYELITARAAETFHAPRCDLYEFDAAAETLTLRGYFEREASGLYGNVGEPQPLAERPGDRAILESSEIVVESVSDPRVDPLTLAEMREWGEKTCLNVPIVMKGEPLGLLIVSETERERVYGADEIELARGLGEQVGMAMQNARLYSRLETQNRRLLNLLQSSREMTGSMDVEKAVETMCSEIAGLLDCPVCHIDVGLRSESGAYVPPVVLAASEEIAANAEPSLEPDAMTERALSERQPQQAELGDAGRRLVIPLFAKDEPSGYVDLSGPAGTRFGDDEIEVVQILANQAAVAIDNALLLHEREKRAITDGLTGLFNHRYFYDRLHSEMARALRYFSPLSLLILDVDDFKMFNDTYGHQAGDEVLRALGKLMLSGIRQQIDIPCRYGGEEFAVILPNTPIPGAQAAGERLQGEFGEAGVSSFGTMGDALDDVPVAMPNPHGAAVVGERIRQEIEQALFVDEAGSPLRRVTVSIGVAAFPEHAVNADELVAAADKALYEAKNEGKNRVRVWDGGGSGTV